MEKTMSSSRAKTITFSVLAALFVVVCAFSFAACGNNSLYNVDFNGTMGDNFKTEYQLEGTTWTESDEEGFEKVYTLTGTVPYNLEFATLPNMGYADAEGNGITNFAVIHISSDLEMVDYNKETDEGFYAKITNYYGTDNETVVMKHSSFKATNENVDDSHDYYLFQGIDNTVKTMTIEISFDGTQENARLYKFVIDPENYELEPAPTTAE